jgi:hypothetical protein
MSNELLTDLADVFPPIEIGLPTRGIFYQPGILKDGVDPSRIAVRTLGVMDELKYRDPFLLVSGKAIAHLIHHLCGDQIEMPEEMCEIDIETILLAARLASYGSLLKVKHICTHKTEEGDAQTSCEHENTVQIDLHEHILRYGPIEHEERFEIVLPRVGQTVYLKPVPYRTTMELMRNVMTTRKRAGEIDLNDIENVLRPDTFAKYEEILNLGSDLRIKSILDCIWAVKTRSGHLIEDPAQIGPWIFELPNSDHDVINSRIAEVTADFRKISLIRYLCGKCGAENEFNLQMNAEILFLVESEDLPIPAISSDTQPMNKNSLRIPSRISRKPRSILPAQ